MVAHEGAARGEGLGEVLAEQVGELVRRREEPRRGGRGLEREAHGAGGGEARGGVALQRRHAHLVEGRGHVGLHGARLLDDGADDLHERAELLVGVEEAAAGEHLPEHDAHGEDVGAAVDGGGADLLRRHVRRLALDEPGARRDDARGREGDAEIGDAPGAVGADEEVLRRHVAVHDAEGMTVVVGEVVRGVEPGEAVDEGAQPRAHADLPRQVEGEPLRHGDALDVVHDEVEAVVALADVHDRNGVRMVDARGDAGLVEEHVDELALFGEVRVHHLDGVEPLEPAGAGEPREPDAPHAAAREQRDELVAVEHAAGGHRVDVAHGQNVPARPRVGRPSWAPAVGSSATSRRGPDQSVKSAPMSTVAAPTAAAVPTSTLVRSSLDTPLR